MTKEEVMELIAREINARHPDKDVVLHNNGRRLVLNDDNDFFGIELREIRQRRSSDRSRFGWNVEPSGLWQVTIGRYPHETKRFRQSKTGAFNWAALDEAITHQSQHRNWQRKGEDTIKANTDVARQFSVDNGLREFGFVNARPSADAGKSIRLQVHIDENMTTAQAQRVLDALAAAGIDFKRD